MCIWRYVFIMAHTSFRVNLHSIVSQSVKELLAQCRCHIWSLSDSSGIWTHNYLVRKRILNHLAKLGKWFNCVMSTSDSASLTLQIWRLLRARCSLTFRQTIECRFTLKLVRDIITYNHDKFVLLFVQTCPRSSTYAFKKL